MRPTWVLGAVVMTTVTAQAQAPISPNAFRDRLAAAISAITHRPTQVTGDQSFRATKADGTDLTVNSDNGYVQYLADPTQVDAIVARYARLLTASDADGATIEQLVVIARPNDYVARSLPAGASAANFLQARPMAGDLSFFLAVDSPETIRLAGRTDLARWHLSEEDAWTRATANIRKRMGSLTPITVNDEQGASGFSAASGLAPSLLADPAFCGPAKPNGIDGQIVLVADRGSFLYAMPSDAAQTRAFWNAVRELKARHAALSETPLTCRGGKWVVVPIP